MVRILAWMKIIIFKIIVNWSFVSPYLQGISVTIFCFVGTVSRDPQIPKSISWHQRQRSKSKFCAVIKFEGTL